MGFYIQTDDADTDIRTLANASCQFWSILTALTINKMHNLIDENGYESDILCISTIYDSIYYIVKDDPKIIKWLNDNIVPIMCTDFVENQVVKNEATGEIGYNWNDLTQIPNGATIEDIIKIRKELD